MRGWGAPAFAQVRDRVRVYDAKLRAPICFDPVAARTVLPLQELRAAVGMQGKDPDAIARDVVMAHALGKLPKMEGVAFAYMWSPHQHLGPGGPFRPHMMIYAPTTTTQFSAATSSAADPLRSSRTMRGRCARWWSFPSMAIRSFHAQRRADRFVEAISVRSTDSTFYRAALRVEGMEPARRPDAEGWQHALLGRHAGGSLSDEVNLETRHPTPCPHAPRALSSKEML